MKKSKIINKQGKSFSEKEDSRNPDNKTCLAGNSLWREACIK
jgi:hypothetical protein